MARMSQASPRIGRHIDLLPTFVRLAVATLGVITMMLATATPAAQAAETVGGGYRAQALAYHTGQRYQCSGWSGGSDGRGHLYTGCNGYVYELDDAGRLVGYLRLPAGYTMVRDVAVDTTGTSMYVATGPIRDQIDPALHPTIGKVLRFVRSVDGTWRRDAGFAAGPMRIGNGYRWAVRGVDVDLAGRVYVTANAYVFQLDGRTGAVRGSFGGGETWAVGGAWKDGLEIAQGIAVARSGNAVYVVEQRFNHVQRWLRVGANGWRRDTGFMLGNPAAASDCSAGSTTRFASPYDVALDGAGNIYVLDVTCRRIQQYRIATRAFVASVWRNYPSNAGENLHHGMAVNWRGTIVVGEMERRFNRAAGPLVVQGSCQPDADAPTLTRVALAAATPGATATLGLGATDRCSRVTMVRVQGSVASTQGWQPMRASLRVTLSGGAGIKRLRVSVRDAYGRVSAIRSVSTRRGSTQALRTRYSINMWGRASACGTGNPLARVSPAGSYRIADRCATFVGSVEDIVRRGTTVYVRVQLSTASARAMYVNATGPVSLWVVGTTRTPTPLGFTEGSSIVVTSALLTDHALRNVYAIPVYQWHRRMLR